ncbi:MAG: RNA polymerase sigma factor [Candidatus Binatia bacterium]
MQNTARVFADNTDLAGEPDPDAQMMLRVRDGDAAAFNELFSKHSPRVVSFVYRFVGSRERAEEITQDAFLQIYGARERYEARARFTTYLYRVAMNLCLNETRRTSHSGHPVPFEGRFSRDGGVEPEPRAEKYVADIEDLMAARETASRIEAVLKKLPAKQKSAFLLARVQGCSYADVADTLEMSENAVKSLVFRATQTLRWKLRDLVARRA